MVKRNIVWSKTATRQLHHILDYWLNRNKSIAYPNKILDLVDEYTEMIIQRPLSFRLCGHNSNRVCIIGVFSIYFKVNSSKIIITSFWDNRQDPKKITKILRKRNGT
jgi:plasmid stabilization system protein ParE